MTLLKKLKNSKIGLGIRKAVPYLAIPFIIATSTASAQNSKKSDIPGGWINLHASNKKDLGVGISFPLFGINKDEEGKKETLARACFDCSYYVPLHATDLNKRGESKEVTISNDYDYEGVFGEEHVSQGAIENQTTYPLFKFGLSLNTSKINFGAGVQTLSVGREIEDKTPHKEIVFNPYLRVGYNISNGLAVFGDINFGSSKDLNLGEASNSSFEIGFKYCPGYSDKK